MFLIPGIDRKIPHSILAPKLRKDGEDFQLLGSLDGAQEIYGSGWFLHDM